MQFFNSPVKLKRSTSHIAQNHKKHCDWVFQISNRLNASLENMVFATFQW